MRRKFKRLILGVILSTVFLVTGCGNKDMFDTVYTFDKAILSLPDGTVVEGDVVSWTDYEDGDQIQVKIDDKTYLVHSSNIVLINED